MILKRGQKPVENLVSGIANNWQATLKAPDKEGAYRLFVYVTDGNNNVATVNLPFLREKLAPIKVA